ncbi:MAG: type II secretion system protein [Pseudomonadota bacterium]
MIQENNRSGFSLIEVAIALTIIGIMVGYAVPTFMKYRQHKQFQVTRNHQEVILYSLASYLLSAKQIPCPADPAAPAKTFGSARLMCTVPANKLIGIVPFRTLGLPESIVKDGFGRYFTYAIDKEVRNEDFGFDDQEDYYCSRKGGVGSNRLLVKNELGESIFSQGTGDNKEREDDFVVAVLVSYGPTGNGAFLKGGSRIKGDKLSLDEQLNTNSTLTFVDRPYSIVTDHPFRQIVKWVSHKNLAGVYARNACRVE